MTNYTDEYIRYCLQLTNENNPPVHPHENVARHNQAMRQLGALYHRVEKEKDRRFLPGLLRHEDLRVRKIAAAHCLGLNVYKFRALRALRKIIRGGGIEGFSAEMTIKMWKKQGHHLTF
ncbi:MAG: hypothetical protein IJS53_03560 [Clostridia bacterium]|nr:hypothetical protein [Clostridia bacterium]